jgi:RNA polymerase sigma-70 factor (ECF subfamily)
MNQRAGVLERYLRRPTRLRLAKVVRAYGEFVWRAAYRVTRHAEDAEDICQDVFLKLLLDPPRPEAVRSPEAYLVWRVAGRAANLRRSDERRRAREAAGVRSASEDGLSAADLDALNAAIGALPEDLRAPLQLRYLAGLSNREIAATLGIAERTVEERLRRGRDTLREALSRTALSFGAVLAALESGTAAIPAGLVARLLRIASMGSALAATAAPIAAGETLMTMKTAFAAGAALLFVFLPASVLVWREARSGREARVEPPTVAPVVLAPEPAAAPQGLAAPVPVTGDPAAPGPVPVSVRGFVRDEDENSSRAPSCASAAARRGKADRPWRWSPTRSASTPSRRRRRAAPT